MKLTLSPSYDSTFKEFIAIHENESCVAKIEINPTLSPEQKAVLKEQVYNTFSVEKQNKDIAINILKIAELCHDSPHSFIVHMLDFVDQNLGEEMSKLPREKFKRIFSDLYTRNNYAKNKDCS